MPIKKTSYSNSPDFFLHSLSTEEYCPLRNPLLYPLLRTFVILCVIPRVRFYSMDDLDSMLYCTISTLRSSHHGAADTIQLGTMRLQVQSLASLSRLRIRHYCDLLVSGIAVVWRRLVSYSSDWTPSLRTSICCGCGPNKAKKTNKQTNKQQ